MSEQTALEVTCGISEIRMIEEIDNLGSELKIEPFNKHAGGEIRGQVK
ncbi:MAG TPA: hypothetical protein VGJ66_13355 [Pyrinomonadaceae bacterium]|jgi:hypothetical protein